MNPVIRHFRTAALLRMRDGRSDGQLLEAFAERREEAAFEALLRRHGPMVLGVCRRVLGNIHDADDAFQATFLVLVRKAAAVRPRELVGNWLYGVAYRTSLKARAMSAKRRSKECQTARLGQAAATDGAERDELIDRLDAELSRLPDKYRAPVVLCELQGKSRKEAARLLGLPEGTLSWRLAQARKLLARRLARHGLPLPGGALAVVGASVPPALLAATAKAGMVMAAGPPLTAGVISTQVLTLTEGVVKAMFLSKLKTVWVIAVAVSVTAAAGLTYQAAAQPAPPGDAPSGRKLSRPPADDLEELRLELAALRKSLQSTRERVKALEDEVQTLRNRGPGGFGGMGGFRAGGGGGGFGGAPGMGGGGFGGGPPGGGPGAGPFGQPGGRGFGRFGVGGRGPDVPSENVKSPRNRPADDDPLADIEAALKKLRQQPDDKDAADALEQALKRLRTRAKTDRPPSPP